MKWGDIVKMQLWSILTIVALSLALFPAVALGEGSAWSIEDLQCNQQTEPMGIAGSNLRFSWRMEGAGKGLSQTAYRIQIWNSTGAVWDSGRVESGESANITYAGPALSSTTRYNWKVTVWDQAGTSMDSADSWFETAFMDAADEFGADFISAVGRTTYSGNYAVEYDVLVTRDSAGFIFAGNSTANNVALQVNIKTGAVKINIIKTAAGKGSNPAGWSLAGAAVTDKIHIRIQTAGTTATIWANGTKMGTYTDALIAFGVFGFRHYNSVNDQETARYENLRITDVDGKALFTSDFSAVNPFKVGALDQGALIVPPITGNYSVSTLADMNNRLRSGGGFTLEMDFCVASTALGICFGGTDARSFLLWQINIKNGEAVQKVYLRPHAFSGGAASTLANVDISRVISWDQRSAWHHIKIAADAANTVNTWVDGVLVDTRTQAMAAMSQVGFRETKGDGEAAWVDNYKLTDSSGDIRVFGDFEDHLDPFSTGHTQNGALYLEKVGLFMRDVEQKGAPMFRTTFQVEPSKTVQQARLYSTALGTYESYLNGQKIGEDLLSPGWTEYYDRITYQSYDVTSMLSSGKNAIGAVVGNGWYAGHVGEGNTNYQYYGIDVAFKGQLMITYTDGTKQVVKTDNSWTCSTDSPYLVTDNSDGETYDARREQPGWNTASFDDGLWKPAVAATNSTIRTNLNLTAIKYQPQGTESVQVYTTLQAKSVADLGNDTYIFDLGQNFAGVVTLTATGVAGQTVRLRYGEMLYDENDGALEGHLYTANLRTAFATDYYTFGQDGTVSYTPHFTYHGFRYVEVSGLGYTPDINAIQGIVLSSVKERTSSLETSSPLINQLYSNTLWSQLANYLSVPTDCPQRDERLGWTGDAQVFAQTAAYNADVDDFLSNFMAILFDKQGANGGLPDFAPSLSSGKSSGGTAGWTDAAVIIPYTLYKTYGDKAVITTYYDNMKAWISQRLSTAKYSTTGSLIIRTSNYGDWLSVGENTPLAVTSTAYFSYSVKLLALMAAAIGQTEDTAYYKNLQNEISAQFKENFVTPDGRIMGDTQTAYALSLGAGVLQDTAMEQKAAARLAQKIRENGTKLTTGFLGVRFLCPILSRYGYSDLAYGLVLQTAYPSWGYSAVNGATTVWERWNSYTAGAGLGANSQLGSTMNSYNHYAYGSVVQWMIEHMAGIQADEEDPGYHHIQLQAEIDPALHDVSATYDSQYGKISSGWTLSGTQYAWTVTIPANTTATVRVPGNGVPGSATCVELLRAENGYTYYAIASGTYTFCGSLNGGTTELKELVQTVDLNFYQKNYLNVQSLADGLDHAKAYLSGMNVTAADTAARKAEITNALAGLEMISQPEALTAVCMKNYSSDPNADSYQITTVSEWIYFENLVRQGVTFQGKTVILANDLDFENHQTQGVGVYSDSGATAFKGKFQGGYHNLNNVDILNTGKGAGVFTATYGAEIYALGVNGTVAAASAVGGIAGYADGGTLIEDCWNEARVMALFSTDGAAGIAGNLRQAGVVRHCYNIGAISGVTNVAGLCSWGQNGTSAATIENSYQAGQLVGYPAYNGTADRYAVIRYNGTVTGKVSNTCYWDMQASSAAEVDGTTAKSFTAFSDGTVAIALNMVQGTDYPEIVEPGKLEKEQLISLLNLLVPYDLNLFVDSEALIQQQAAAQTALNNQDSASYAACNVALQSLMANMQLKNSYPLVPDIKDFDLYRSFGGKVFGVSDRVGMDLLSSRGRNGNFGTLAFQGYTIFLLNDIDMGGAATPFTPITQFYGTLDGKNHVVNHLYVEVAATTSDHHAGLIASLITGGVVQNLGVASGTVRLTLQADVGVSAGAIVGSAWRANIYNCWNGATVEGVLNGKSGTIKAGGIIGSFSGSTAGTYQLVNCYNVGAITGSTAGGLAGEMSNSSNFAVYNGYSAGVLNGAVRSDALVAGLTQNIKNCYFTAGISSYATAVTEGDLSSGALAYQLNQGGVAGNVPAAQWTIRENSTVMGTAATVKLTYLADGTVTAVRYTDADGKPIGQVEAPKKAGYQFMGWQNTQDTYGTDTELVATFEQVEVYDLNGDGAFGMADIILLMRYINGHAVTLPIEKADVNLDGKIGIADVVALLELLAQNNG